MDLKGGSIMFFGLRFARTCSLCATADVRFLKSGRSVVASYRLFGVSDEPDRPPRKQVTATAMTSHNLDMIRG